jgi:hypothetical protein
MIKHYTQYSKEAQDEHNEFEWEEKKRANMAVFKLTLICSVLLGAVIAKVIL